MKAAFLTAVLATILQGTVVRASPPINVDAASRAFDDAQYRQDKAALDRMLAADMVYIRGSGARVGRMEFLAAFSDSAVVFDPFVITDREIIQLTADVAVVTAEGTITSTEAGQRVEDHFRFSDTFRRSRGVWQVVYVQVTRLPAR
jgi:ketosteroid isomerase-like protein